MKLKTTPHYWLLIALGLSMVGSVEVSATPVNYGWQQLVRRHLPPDFAIRLPSQNWFNYYVGPPQDKFIQVKPVERSSLTVNIFNCTEQIKSCLVGSIAVKNRQLATAPKELKQSLASATPISLSKNLRAYLLTNPESTIIWEQAGQVYTVKQQTSPQNLILLAKEIANSPAIANLQVLPANTRPGRDAPQQLAQSTAKSPRSPLTTRHPVLTSAEQLNQGEVLVNLRYRQSFPDGTAADTGLTGQPTIGLTWGVTDKLELGLDVQTVDNSGPGPQGRFNVRRLNTVDGDNSSPNFFQEITFQGKHRIWENTSGTQAFSGVIAVSSSLQGRPYQFVDSTNGRVTQGENGGLITSVELPYTISVGDRAKFTLSPKIAFLPSSHALYLHRPPVSNPGSFGTTFGVAGGATYQVLPRLVLWGDAFLPLTGNNSINRETGFPARTVTFNAGLRYLVNPRLATDLFVSNALGNTGAMSVIGDRAYTSLGLGVTFLPGVTSANRKYAQSFSTTQSSPPNSFAGFAFLDGGTVANQQAVLNLAGGSQGILTSLRYGLLDDLEIGIFLDYVSGTIDESQLGLSGKIRFLHQADGDPLTLSGVATFARSNNVLINVVNNNRNEFAQRDLNKGGFAFSNERDGELFIITLSTPLHYQFSGGSAVWLTPTLGYIQRNGLQIAGFNLGGSLALNQDLDAIAEAGINFTSEGNAFTGDGLENVIPWTVGLRWQPSTIFGVSKNTPLLEAYLTNRVGASPFETLRVRADNDLAVGVGLVLPVQF